MYLINSVLVIIIITIIIIRITIKQINMPRTNPMVLTLRLQSGTVGQYYIRLYSQYSYNIIQNSYVSCASYILTDGA